MLAGARSPIRVVGRYAIYSEIAAGGMATIHLGRLLGPVGFARTVAVKRLHPQYAKDPEFVSGFLDEARLAARVQHPNVVATIDVVATEGELFLIMDYVRGESLSKILRTIRQNEQHVPPRIAAAIMCGFLHGLHAAHEAKNERGEPLGLVHRDVSPQNVLVGSDGIPRVLDFGIAKAQGRIQVTRDGQIKGKLAYMPPEQLAGKELSRTVDIYASAVVMWEMLTTERLFKGETEKETLQKILRDPVAPPSSFVPSLPQAFDVSLLRALSRDVTKRHATAKELALELERCVGIASPTEVGEWVEAIVGPVLSAREDQIAEIESNSASLRESQAAHGELNDPDSDSDVVAPNAHAILAATSSSGNAHSDDTLRHGSGAMSEARDGREGTGPRRGHDAGADTVVMSQRPFSTFPRQELSESRSRTATFSLPVDKKLLTVVSIAGIGILLLVVGIVVSTMTGGGKSSRGSTSATTSLAPPPRLAPAADSAASNGEVPTDPSAGSDIPPPEPPLAADPKAPAKPIFHSPPRPVPPPKPSVVAPTPVKKNCDPNYIIDAQGRKKYKLECM